MRLVLLALLSVAVGVTSLEQVQLALPAAVVATDDHRPNALPKKSSSLSSSSSTALQHYGKPPTECEADEKAFQIQGIPGAVCSALCTDFKPCPTDLPANATATPKCALQAPNGARYCVLMCAVGNEEKEEEDKNVNFLRGGGGVKDAQCGAGATCHPVPNQGVGICTYE